MEIRVYAPVFIPTLNRYDNFRNCLESLEKCTGADKTDVYVGLDFPPSAKYVEGWKKIDSYLKEKEKYNGFGKLIVERRNYNYGLMALSSNLSQLIHKYEVYYDRIILSEDDNVFSPNFLEYINKGLELYKNDKRIVGICGYKNDFDCKTSGNNHFAQHSLFQGWGYGIWLNRRVDIRETLTPSYFRRILYNPKRWYNCFKYWPHWFNIFFIGNAFSCKNNLPSHDVNLGFYLVNENKCVICPTVSKVRNMGWDASATTTYLEKGNLRGRAEHENNLVIDQEKTFEFLGNPYQYEDENSMEIAKWDGQWETDISKSLIYAYLKIWKFRLLALFGIV